MEIIFLRWAIPDFRLHRTASSKMTIVRGKFWPTIHLSDLQLSIRMAPWAANTRSTWSRRRRIIIIWTSQMMTCNNRKIIIIFRLVSFRTAVSEMNRASSLKRQRWEVSKAPLILNSYWQTLRDSKSCKSMSEGASLSLKTRLEGVVSRNSRRVTLVSRSMKSSVKRHKNVCMPSPNRRRNSSPIDQRTWGAVPLADRTKEGPSASVETKVNRPPLRDPSKIIKTMIAQRPCHPLWWRSATKRKPIQRIFKRHFHLRLPQQRTHWVIGKMWYPSPEEI